MGLIAKNTQVDVFDEVSSFENKESLSVYNSTQ